LTDLEIWDSVGLCLQREFMQSHSNQNGTLAGHHNQPAGPATRKKGHMIEKDKDPFGFHKAINWDKLKDPKVLKELEKIFEDEEEKESYSDIFGYE